MIDQDLILQVDSVGHRFGGFLALKDVSLKLRRGGLGGLIGPNGSGKTTLFNIITGYLPLQSGRVVFDGAELGRMSTPDRASRGLIRTFQTPKIFDGMTVLENVMVGALRLERVSMYSDLIGVRHSRRRLAVVKEKAENTCIELGLGSLRDRLGGGLTAGQRRMLELARAAVSEPKAILLDEPSSGLSDGEVDRLIAIVRSMNSRGITVLLVSHDMALMKIVEQVSVLYFGDVIALGTMSEVTAQERVRQVYLGG